MSFGWPFRPIWFLFNAGVYNRRLYYKDELYGQWVPSSNPIVDDLSLLNDAWVNYHNISLRLTSKVLHFTWVSVGLFGFFPLWFKISYSLLYTNICTLNILDMKSDMFLVSYRECMVKLVLNYFQVIDILIYDNLKIRIHMKYDNNNKNFINHVMYTPLYISTVCCIIGCKTVQKLFDLVHSHHNVKKMWSRCRYVAVRENLVDKLK